MKKPQTAMQELKALERTSIMFEWYVNHGWNYHRHFVKRHLTARCSQCAISANYSPLNTHGICKLCEENKRQDQAASSAVVEQAKQDLHALLANAQGLGKNTHDVLVLFSGGKDSIFLIHELKRLYPKLRILAYLVDSGMMGPRTLINAQKATDSLDVDYLHSKPDVQLFKTLYREAALFEKPGYGCLETGDLMEFGLILTMAAKHAAQVGIPYVVDGLNWAQIAIAIGEECQTSSERMLGCFSPPAATILSEKTKLEFASYFQAPDPVKAPEFLHPFFAWRFTENEIRKQVVERGYIDKGSDSPVLTNNRFISAMFFIDYARNGYGSYENDICSQVREGTADRIYWRNIFEMADYSAKTGWMIKDIIARFQKDLGMAGNPFKLSWVKG